MAKFHIKLDKNIDPKKLSKKDIDQIIRQRFGIEEVDKNIDKIKKQCGHTYGRQISESHHCQQCKDQHPRLYDECTRQTQQRIEMDKQRLLGLNIHKAPTWQEYLDATKPFTGRCKTPKGNKTLKLFDFRPKK